MQIGHTLIQCSCKRNLIRATTKTYSLLLHHRHRRCCILVLLFLNVAIFSEIASRIKGQLSLRCLNPSVSMIALSTSLEAINLRQASLSRSQLCCSPKARVVATVCTSMPWHSLASHNALSLSSPYLSAATSKCCIVVFSSESQQSGRESAYMK